MVYDTVMTLEAPGGPADAACALNSPSPLASGREAVRSVTAPAGKVGGSLVGDFVELVELMEMNADGKVRMHQTEYKLANINQAITDFKDRKFTGRGVIVP